MSTKTEPIWIMTWGSKAEVLEPESLKKEIRAEAERMLMSCRRDLAREDTDVAFNL